MKRTIDIKKINLQPPLRKFKSISLARLAVNTFFVLFQDEVVDLKGCSEADTCNYLNGIGHDDKEQKRLETLIQKLGYKDWEVGKAELG